MSPKQSKKTPTIVLMQAEVWFDAAVLAEEGALPPGRLLLEEEEGRQDHAGGPHEAQGPGHGGRDTVLSASKRRLRDIF